MIDPLIKIDTIDERINKLENNNIQYRGILKEIHIADIHFGAMNPEYQYHILCEQMLMPLQFIDFDIFSINGDLFDHKFMSNSNVIMYACKFIDKVVKLCRIKNATLLILHGTLLHDADQLKLFYHYIEDNTVDVRIIEQIQFEYVKGAKILCIPELYNKGKDYYNKFLLYNMYDSVFMHGEFKGAIYNEHPEIGLDSKKNPVFTMDDFKYCMGPIISGHVHTPGCFEQDFYYSGSPYRWKFGEEEEKGFLIVLHNLDTHQYYVELQPIKSFRYDTINLDEMLLLDPKNVIEYINNLQSNGIDYLRIQFTEVNDNNIANINILKTHYRNNSKIKIDVKEDRNKVYLEKNKETINKYKEYDYVLDKNLSEYEKLSKYINQKKGSIYITADELKNILLEEI